MDFFLPTAVETPPLRDRLHRHPLAAPPDRRQGRGRVAQRRRRLGLLERGQRRLRPFGLTHTPMPHDHWRVWRSLGPRDRGRGPPTSRAMAVVARLATATPRPVRRATPPRPRCSLALAHSCARPRVRWPVSLAPPPPRGRGRRRQDRGREGPRRGPRARASSACSATRGSTPARRSTSGTTSASSSPSAPREAARPRRGRGAHLLRGLPPEAAAARGDHPGPRRRSS